MKSSGQKSADQQDEFEVKLLSRVLERQSVQVRREKLSRGREYRVKSGSCTAFGDKLLFLDRNLPPSQQLSVLVDFIVDRKIPLSEEDIEPLSELRKEILRPMLEVAPHV